LENLNEEIEKIWSILPHPEGSVIRVFARNSAGEVAGDFARNTQEMVRFARQYCSFNCYICPNPTFRTDGVRHSTIDVSHWSFFFLDIDPVDDIYNIDLALEEVLAKFSGYVGRDLFKKPPTIINSGRGIQVWVRGVDKELNEDFPHKLPRRMMSYWLHLFHRRLGKIHGCELDVSVSDLPRPMRMPGTTNTKTGRTASILSLQAKPFPWLFPFFIAGTPNEATRDQIIISMPGVKWQMVANKLSSQAARRYLSLGQCEPGRHKVMWHTARCLFEVGVSKEEAFKALSWANKLKGPEEELDFSSIQHALETAYAVSDVITTI